MDDWRRVLAEVEAGTARVLATLEGLADADMRAPSGLPGWTRGHVATHIARNADSLVNLLESARTGVAIPQYPSLEARNGGIESGAGRDAASLAEDVRATGERFAAKTRELSDDDWQADVVAMAGWKHPLCGSWPTGAGRRWRPTMSTSPRGTASPTGPPPTWSGR